MLTTARIDEERLSAGAVRAMFEGKPVHEPWLQFLQIKVYEKPNGGGVHYKIVVSDGQHFIQGTLTPQLNSLVSEKKLDPFCVAKVVKFSVNQLKDHRLIFISEISLDGIVYGSQKIGGPVNVENDPNIPQSNTNNNTNGNTNSNTTTIGNNNTGMAPNQPGSGTSRPAPNSSTLTAAGDNDEMSIQPISAISPYHNRWVIKARIGSKSEVKKFTNQKGEGKLFSCTLLDESGEIKMTGFGDAVDKFYDLITPGKVYLISNAACKMAKRQFSNVDNEYEIHLESNSVIQLSKEDPNACKLPTVRYKFVPIATLATHDKDKFVDVIGVAREIGEAQSFTAKASGRQLNKRDITLLDQSGAEIKLTLWGQEALGFATSPIMSPCVVAVKGAKIGEYQGGRNLSTLSSSNVTADPDIPEAHRLRGWYSSSQITSVTNLSTSNALSQSISDSRKTLSQIKQEGLGRGPNADYFSVLASVQHIRSEDNKVWYEACPQDGCNKKVFNEGPSQWRCEKCQRMFDHCTYRYILSAQLADHTDAVWVNVFAEQAEQLLGTTASHLATLKQQSDPPTAYERILKEPQHKYYVFRIRAKAENYQGEDRMRLNVVALSKVDAVKEGLSMLSQLELVDNSDDARNGDYSSSRLDAQLDAAQSIFAAKRRGNVESTVALMCAAGPCPRVLLSLSTDQRKLLAALGKIRPEGRMHLVQALKVAQMALSHRPNTNQRQRIVLLVASPIGMPEQAAAGKDLVALGKTLRKNGVAVDVIGMAGDENAANSTLLEAFVDAVDVGAEVDDGDRKSRFLEIPAGESVTEAISTNLFGSASTPSMMAAADFDDADLDPELAMALKLSLQEEMARQSKTAVPAADTDHQQQQSDTKNNGGDDEEADEDDPELAQAIAMSLEK